ncbi:MAG: tyrosine-protein kinase domain-containing protein [Candidatus Aquicultorales bacterium]
MAALETSPDLRHYISIVSRRRRFILAGITICLVATAFFTAYTPPVYESSTVLLVSERRVVVNNMLSSADSYQGLLMSERLARTYSEVLSSKAVSAEMGEDLGLRTPVDKLDSKVSAEPVKDTNLIKVTAQDSNPSMARALAEKTVEVFMKKLKSFESVDGKNVQSAVKVSVVEPASAPIAPVRPKPVVNMVLALVLGTIGSIGTVFAIEYLDVSIRHGDDLEKVAKAPLLGLIPTGESSGGPEVLSKPSSLTAEAYRTLRTNIQYLNFDSSLRKIAITSPGSGEGKTTIASNLAVALTKSGQRVVLISCDLRKPGIHRLFHVPNDVGLSNVLAGDAGFQEIVFHVDDSLRIIPSGPVPPNPAELLGSERMRETLESAAETSDFVLLDCPPVLPVTDAAVVASMVDGFLLISRAGETSRTAVVQAKDSLDKISAKVSGVVLNFFNPSSAYGSHGYYYYYKHADQ